MKAFLCLLLRARMSPLVSVGVCLVLAVVGLLLDLSSDWFILAIFPTLFLTNPEAECRWFKRRP